MIMIHQLEILGQFGIIPLINHDSRLRSPGFGRFYFASSDGSTHLRALTVARASLGQLHLTRSIVLSPLVGKITEKPPSIVLGCLGALGLIILMFWIVLGVLCLVVSPKENWLAFRLSAPKI